MKEMQRSYNPEQNAMIKLGMSHYSTLMFLSEKCAPYFHLLGVRMMEHAHISDNLLLQYVIYVTFVEISSGFNVLLFVLMN